jgi:hypothetical protein
MAITLTSAMKGALNDIDLAVIDEARKSSYLLNALTFDDCVNPAGGGSTLVYGYVRETTERGAASRQQNTEYVAAEAARTQYTVNLVPFGGSFQVDRVLANVGPAASTEVAWQLRSLNKSVIADFHDEFINGTAAAFDQASPGFAGLAATVNGSNTDVTATTDWSAVSTLAGAHDALDELDEWIDEFDGVPDALFGNTKGIARLRSIARRADYYEKTRDEFGREVESYRGIPFVNLREKPGSSSDIIGTTAGASAIYGVRFGLDGVHAVSAAGVPLLQTWLPDFSTAGAVKKGEVEMAPCAVVVKRSRAAGRFNVTVSAASS